MYNIIRLLIGVVFLGYSTIIIKKSKVIRKQRLYVVFFCISVVLTSVSALLPFENLFISFDSPKEAYEYYNNGRSNIKLVAEGNNCDFVVDCKNDSDTYLIVPKTADGWKIGIGLNTKRIIKTFCNGISVVVYQYKDTNDFFITVYDLQGKKLNITDDYNTEFFPLERYNDYINETFTIYYAHIGELNSQYSILADGNKILLKR